MNKGHDISEYTISYGQYSMKKSVADPLCGWVLTRNSSNTIHKLLYMTDFSTLGEYRGVVQKTDPGLLMPHWPPTDLLQKIFWLTYEAQGCAFEASRVKWQGTDCNSTLETRTVQRLNHLPLK